MSGGSYEYLCYADPSDISEKRRELNDMRDRLTELGYIDVAQETESVLLILDSFEVRMGARIKRLSEVWRAVEWCDSGDTDKDHIASEVEKYRNL